MNTSLWQLAAWTMIHSLWIGGIVAILGATLRLACRRAAANNRYAVSLATLAALAMSPIAAATWLVVNGVPQLAAAPVPVMDSALLPPLGGEGWGGGPAGHMTLDAFSSHPPQLAPQIIDLAHLNPSHRYSGERLGEGPTPLTTTPTNNPSTIATVENPFPTPSLPGRGTAPPLPLPPSALPLAISRLISLLPTLWLIGAPLTFLLLAAGLIGSERLRRRATPIVSGPAYDACQRLRHALKITRRIALAACDEIAQPILVGIVRPLILLPTAALAGWTPEQLDMVLLHELAHVRRWDNLVNLAQRIVESLIFYHPAVWLVSRQVRRDREECCDATVVARIPEPTHYAELLITIAATSRSRLSGAPSLTLTSAMATHPLAGRIRRILNLQEEPMRITRRTLAATLLLPLLLAAAILYSGANAEDGKNPPPSKGGARGGTETAEQSDAPASDKQTETSGDQSASLAEENLRGSTDAQLKSQEEYVALRSSQEQSLRQEANRPIEDVIAAEFLTDRAISTFQRMLETPGGIEDDRQSVREMLSNLRSMKDKLEIQRRDYRKAVEEAIRKRLDSRTSTAIYADLVANRGVSGPRPPQTEHPNSSTTDIHFTVAAQLHHEIRNLESLVAKAQEELVNLETFKELAVRGSQKSGALEEAVEAELSKDPTIKLYNEQLVAMQSALKSREYEASDSNGKRLRALLLQTEAQFAEYRQIAEKAARDRIAKQPNETLRAAVIEYKIRRKAAEDNLVDHKQDLETAKAQLAQLTATSAAPATPPAPLLDRLEQLRLAFEQQRPLFASRTDAPLSKVTYDAANLPTIVDEHWNYLAEGIRNRDGLPPIGWSWTRDAGQQYVIEAPQHAHEQFLKPLFDGKLPTVQPASPASPNQSAATAESHPEEKPQSEWNVTATKEFIVHFPPNFPDSQQERKRIGKDFKDSYIRTVTLGTPQGDQFAHTLHVRVPVDWNPKAVWESHANGNAVRMVCRIVNEPAAAHPPLTTLRPEASIQGAATASPGSPNQGGEATRSPSDKTPSTAQASRGSAAPVQEPVLPAPSQTAPTTATSHDENAPDPLSQALADLEQRKQAVLEAQAALRAAEKGTTYAKDELIEKYVALNWEETPERQVLQQQEAAIRAQLKKQTASGAARDDATVRHLQASLAQIKKQLDERLESMKVDVTQQVATSDQQFLDNRQNIVRNYESQQARNRLGRAQREFQEALIRLNQLATPDTIAPPRGPTTPANDAQAASPGSPNQGGEATGSTPDKTPPAPRASRSSAAPVQEPELPAPAANSPSPSPFPTLEHQKIADRAYRLFGVEFEPLRPVEFERVKKLGYPGGLRVAKNDGGGSNLPPEDLLVGLHVWPITDLESFGVILNRDDLGEFMPIKYYVIRSAGRDNSGASDPAKDQVVTGRLQVPRGTLAERSKEQADRELAQLEAIDLAATPDVTIEVVQPPTSVATGILGGSSRTTAYLKVAINRSTNPFDAAAKRATPQQIAGRVKDCLALIESPAVLKAALDVVTPRDLLDMGKDEAVEHLKKRFTAAFPGDGEILELKLEGANAKEDAALLQAIIDAFIAAMKTPPQSPADPNAASDSAGAPGDLSRYMAGTADRAPKAGSSGAADYKHPVGFAKALEQCRKSGKPVVVHLLAHNSAPSNRFADEVLADPQVADFIAKHFVSVTIYADDESAFAKAYHVDFVPANIFVFAGGVRTTGSIAVPAIPAEYLAYLKNYYELAITSELQKLAGHIVPELWPAPVADRPGAGGPGSPNQGGEATGSPSDKPSPTAAASPDSAAPVQESEAPAYAPPTATFLYDGKTFEQWRDLWKLELNPERRAEAINALAAFGRSGRGQEAADAILEVAGEYPDSYSPTSAEGKLLKAIDAAVARMPAEQWMPQVLQRINSSEGPAKKQWRQLAVQFLFRTRDQRPEARALAAKFADGDDAMLLGAASYYLLQNDLKLADPLTVELVRKTLRNEGYRHQDHLRLLGLQRLDLIPEQLDLILRQPRARSDLQHMVIHNAASAKGVITPILIAAKERESLADRIGALRAIKGFGPALSQPGNHEIAQQVADQLIAFLNEGPDDLLPAAMAAYARVGHINLESIPDFLVKQKKIPADRAEQLKQLDREQLLIELNAE